MGQFLYAAPNHVVYIDIIGDHPTCKRRNPLYPTGMLQEYRCSTSSCLSTRTAA